MSTRSDIRPQPMKVIRISIVAALFLCLISTGVFAFGSPRQVKINDVYVIMFILDGAPRDLVYGMVENNELPNIKKYLWDNGAHFDNVVTTFPSASSSAYQSFITGLLPGRSGVPYLQRFDREKGKVVEYFSVGGIQKLNDDLNNFRALNNPNIKFNEYPVTIFERMKGIKTASVYSEVNRGAKISSPILGFGAFNDAFIRNKMERLDARAYKELKKLFKDEDPPRFTLAGLLSIDLIQHKEGASSEDTKLVLIQFDIFLGEFIQTLKEKQIFDKTYLVVESDHGMHNIEKTLDLKAILKAVGLKHESPDPRHKDSDFFVSERGVASAQIYFKWENGWEDRVNVDKLRNYKGSVDVIDLLVKSKDVELLVVRDSYDEVRVFGKDGNGTIAHVDVNGRTYYGYQFSGSDPLKYGEEKSLKGMLDGKMYDADTWLSKTVSLEYPDAVVQLGQLFDDGKAGDVFVVPKKNVGFYRDKAATHGSLIREDMNIPLMIRGPGINGGGKVPVRSVDLYPTILSWFGIEDTKYHDGREIPFNSEATAPVDETGLTLANMESVFIGGPTLMKMVGTDEFKEQFKKRFSGSVGNEKLLKLIDAELKRRSIGLAKLKDESLSDFYIKGTFEEIWRLEDVKAIVTEPTKRTWYGKPL